MLPRDTQQIIDEYIVMKRALIQARVHIDHISSISLDYQKDDAVLQLVIGLALIETLVQDTLEQLGVPAIEDIMGTPNKEKE